MTKMDWNKWIQTVGGRLIQISVACRINFTTKIYIYIYSEYDINSQHQTSKISADSCWVPPGESTMIHQFRQTWHEHAWQSIDNSIYIHILVCQNGIYHKKSLQWGDITAWDRFNLSDHEDKTSMTSSQPYDMCRDASPSSLIDWWVQQPVGCTDS